MVVPHYNRPLHMSVPRARLPHYNAPRHPVHLPPPHLPRHPVHPVHLPPPHPVHPVQNPHQPHFTQHPFHMPPHVHPAHVVATWLHHGGHHHGDHGYYDVDGVWWADPDFPPYDGDVDAAIDDPDYAPAPVAAEPDTMTPGVDADGYTLGNSYGAIAAFGWRDGAGNHIKTQIATAGDQESADAKAINGCGYDNCKVVYRFWHGSCGYTSVSAANGWAWGADATPQGAYNQCASRKKGCNQPKGLCTGL
jgi:hypothetical protein